jgi:hypothetical protein
MAQIDFLSFPAGTGDIFFQVSIQGKRNIPA